MQLISALASTVSTLPPALPGLGGKALTAFQIFMTAGAFSREANEDTRAQYSKFARDVNPVDSKAVNDDAASGKAEKKTWPSQTGMMVIYTPAFLASASLLLLGSPDMVSNPTIAQLSLPIPQPSPAALLCAIHFAKRVLEVLFLHKYSGRVDRGTPSMIGFYYALIATLVAYAGDPMPRESAVKIGTALFAVGIAGNFYHHYLLANLRKSSTGDSENGSKKYVAPRGGLFKYVAAPHYLFELIGWLGMAIASNHLNVFLIFTSMSSYLSGRSVAQNEFNRKKFAADEWPEDRKNLIPFVF